MKEYNWEDLTTDQIAELFREKTWQERNKSLLDYIEQNYSDIHPNKIPLERLEQIKRNLQNWKQKLFRLEEKEMLQSIDFALDSINSRIEYLKKAEVKPKSNRSSETEKYLSKMNDYIFNNSTLEQWEKVFNHEVLNEGIRIKKKVTLKEFVCFLDEFKFKVGFKITDAEIQRNTAFKFEGIPVTAIQIRQARFEYKNKEFEGTLIDKIWE